MMMMVITVIQFIVLENNPRALPMLGKWSTSELPSWLQQGSHVLAKPKQDSCHLNFPWSLQSLLIPVLSSFPITVLNPTPSQTSLQIITWKCHKSHLPKPYRLVYKGGNRNSGSVSQDFFFIQLVKSARYPSTHNFEKVLQVIPVSGVEENSNVLFSPRGASILTETFCKV